MRIMRVHLEISENPCLLKISGLFINNGNLNCLNKSN